MKCSDDSPLPRVGVIGLGSMGRNHARIYHEMSAVRLVAVADINEEASNAVATRFNAIPYTNYMTMVDKEKLDIVSIAVPTGLHGEVAAKVIDCGVNLLIEKPLASSVREGERIIRRAEKRNVRLGVGHVERFNPVIMAMKQRMDEGFLGRVFQIIIRRAGPFPERIKDTGVILDLAIHDTDLMHYLIGSEIRRISSESGQFIHDRYEDTAVSLLSFVNGVIGVLVENWISPTKVRDITVNGENGTLCADLLTQDLFFYENNYTESKWESLAAFRGVSEGNMTRFHLPRHEPLRRELESFVAAVACHEPFAVEGRDGLRALKTVQRLLLVSQASKNRTKKTETDKGE
ncbi:MAG TPA: Gfo/Idh/MocA family oxidoreductase [Syntrophomonadaceae bacterium]|nr:Gfo/Idh/MocA family oxidoreductase [Syntrophomonadaceae bacterium]